MGRRSAIQRLEQAHLPTSAIALRARADQLMARMIEIDGGPGGQGPDLAVRMLHAEMCRQMREIVVLTEVVADALDDDGR